MKPGKDYIGVGGGVLIFNKKGEILLIKRGKGAKNNAGLWCKPGGTVEFGEKAFRAMEREINEEMGIKIKIWGLMPHVDHIIGKENQHWVAIQFLGDLKSGKPKIKELEKCEEIRWVNPMKAPKKLTQTTREAIKNFLKGNYIRL